MCIIIVLIVVMLIEWRRPRIGGIQKVLLFATCLDLAIQTYSYLQYVWTLGSKVIDNIVWTLGSRGGFSKGGVSDRCPPPGSEC